MKKPLRFVSELGHVVGFAVICEKQCVIKFLQTLKAFYILNAVSKCHQLIKCMP